MHEGHRGETHARCPSRTARAGLCLRRLLLRGRLALRLFKCQNKVQMPTSCFSLHHVDAFAAAPFTGNPAAVLTVPLGPSGAPQLDAAAMQAIAAELNLSETAFIAPLAGSPTADDNDKASPFSSNAAFSLRWFTPSNEVKLCGHATLAAAHVLFKHYANAHACIDFHTLSGVLRVGRSSDGSASAGGLRMQFPANVASTRESALDGSADPAAAAIIQAVSA